MSFGALGVAAIGAAGTIGSSLLGGGGGGGAGVPLMPAGPVNISFGSRTLGTGAKGGDTAATGGDGSNVNAAGGAGALPSWLPVAVGASIAALVVAVLVLVFRPRKRRRD